MLNDRLTYALIEVNGTTQNVNVNHSDFCGPGRRQDPARVVTAQRQRHVDRRHKFNNIMRCVVLWLSFAVPLF